MKNIQEIYYCKFCGRQSFRKCANTYHENRCSKNPNSITTWYTKKCPQCSKEFKTTSANIKFCSKNCSMHFSGNKSRIHSELYKKKVSDSLKKYFGTYNKPVIKKFCKACGEKLGKRNKSGYCRKCISKFRVYSSETRKKLSLAGRRAASHIVKRSKNEIAFCEEIEKIFADTIHNIPMFNGWDADVIIPSKKVAILWNGNFHYKDIFGQLRQIQK